MTQNHDDTDAKLNEMMARGREAQNSTVRTRDEQANELVSRINDYRMDYPEKEIPAALAEAEARGAAEQRRKDAEGNEVPSAWVRPNDFYNDEGNDRFGPWSSEQIGEYTIPLYSRPANVAALEARVKELDGERDGLKRQLQAMSPGRVQPVIHSPTRFMDDSRAALTREGGE